MYWKMILLEGWKFLFMSFLANTTRRFCRKILDALLICLLLRYTCIGFFCLVLFVRSILRKQIGSTLLSTLPVTSLLMVSLYRSNRRVWWGVPFSSYLLTGRIGIELRVLITSSLYPMTLVLAFTIRWVSLSLYHPGEEKQPIRNLCITGRKSYWKRNSPTTPACYVGPNFWATEPCLFKGWFHHYSSICTSTEDANPFDPS